LRVLELEEEPMPYQPKHKQDTRERILESARQLFNANGFSEVSIDAIMAHAGLTHGGFYRHFACKEELFAESVRHFMCRKTPEAWQAKQAALNPDKPRALRIVDAYFSRDHFDERESCCPLLATASDASRGSQAVKAAYREVAEKLVDVFEAHLSEPEGRERALAVLALCVGGMVLARGVDDPGLANAFRSAAHREALKTFGTSEAPAAA
jgi:TetR/AcrR family transcriptional regulator, transcriptional repressor for nem operon